MGAALLDVTSPAELDGFLRRLLVDVVRRSGGQLPVERARALLSTLRQLALRTVPTLAWASPPAPSSPVAAAAQAYGLELEGLSAEDRDFEIARQFTRLADAAINHAAHRSPTLPARTTVGQAMATAAEQFAPGLLPVPFGLPVGRPTNP
jgi:hypothetical protein